MLPIQSKLYKYKEKSAGGIIIDPWSNIHDPEKYNVLIIKQRLGNNWGLPKGHCEQGEDLEICAMREIKEETGFDFQQLQEGYDYLKINFRDKNNVVYNNKKIKKITFFMYILLKRGNLIQKYKRDYHEIKDLAWINIPRLKKLCNKNHPNFKCNRTLNVNSSLVLKKICETGCQILHQYLYSVDKNSYHLVY